MQDDVHQPLQIALDRQSERAGLLPDAESLVELAVTYQPDTPGTFGDERIRAIQVEKQWTRVAADRLVNDRPVAKMAFFGRFESDGSGRVIRAYPDDRRGGATDALRLMWRERFDVSSRVGWADAIRRKGDE